MSSCGLIEKIWSCVILIKLYLLSDLYTVSRAQWMPVQSSVDIQKGPYVTCFAQAINQPRRCDVNSSHTTILSAMHNGSNYWGSVAAIGFSTINLKSVNLQYKMLGPWHKRLIDQGSDVPSIFFFIISCKILGKNHLIYFSILIT